MSLRALAAAWLLAAAASAEEGTPVPPPAEVPAADVEPPPTIGGQVHVRYEKTDPGPSEGVLSLARAKVEVGWQPKKRIEGVVAVDVAPAVEADGVVRPLDAYLQVETWKWLRVRAGHRKVPFSGLRLQSLSRMRTITRGEYARQLDLVFVDLGSADLARDVGVDLRLRAPGPGRVRADLGLSQGDFGPKEFAGRVTARPLDALDLGAAVAIVHVDTSNGEQRRMIGQADVTVEAGGFHAEVEGALGDANDPEGDDEFAALYALLAYRFALGADKTPALEPLLRFDVVDQKLRVGEDHAFAVTGGLNFYPRKYLRLMLDVERVERFDRYRERPAPDETRLLVQLAFDV